MISEEYSERFDELRKNRVEVSFFKYGPAKEFSYWKRKSYSNNGEMY